MMFKTRNYDNLLFSFSRSGRREKHSFFVFFPFIAIWLDDRNRVLEWRVVKPFEYRVSSRRAFHKLIEIPISYKNEYIMVFLVGKKKGLNTFPSMK